MARFGSLGDGQFASLGKANRYKLSRVFSTNTTETTVNVSAIAGYKPGKSDITITVNSGVYLYSTNTATPALTITGATTGDRIYLVNDGFIMGKGGNGVEPSGFNGVNGLPGGPAMSLGFNITITNNSYIAGGGGGGGAGVYPSNAMTGGGAGGGNGGGANINYTGGVGGGPGQPGAQGTSQQANFPNYGGGGGGGRILPGTGGFAATFPTKPGGGGAGGGSTVGGGQGSGSPGAGGSAGNAGQDTGVAGAGGGGGWGARGGNADVILGGTGGKAIALNGFTVTYITQGTLYGAVS